jgi:hypothetical protein
MAKPVHVLVLSHDELLRELLLELFTIERLPADAAASVGEARALCEGSRADVLLVDAIADPSLASALLDDPWTVLGERQPPLVLLASSSTPSEIAAHGWVDRTLSVPIETSELVGALLYHASGRARRQMRSGIRAREAVDHTFQSKRLFVTKG